MAGRGLAEPAARRPARPVLPAAGDVPNEKYAALVAAAGYLPVPLSGEDYLEPLPATWRAVNDYGIRIDSAPTTTPLSRPGAASTPG